MQKISPLRAGLEAFNKFKATRLENSKTEKNHSNSSNPFGISFKGTVMQMDVFESTKKKEDSSNNPIKSGLEKVNKFVASARTATMNKFDSFKKNAISFGNKIKENVQDVCNKLATTEVDFGFMKNSSASLQKRPVAELEDMFKTELDKAGA